MLFDCFLWRGAIWDEYRMEDRGSNVTSNWITQTLYYKTGSLRKLPYFEIQFHAHQDKNVTNINSFWWRCVTFSVHNDTRQWMYWLYAQTELWTILQNSQGIKVWQSIFLISGSPNRIKFGKKKSFNSKSENVCYLTPDFSL